MGAFSFSCEVCGFLFFVLLDVYKTWIIVLVLWFCGVWFVCFGGNIYIKNTYKTR